MTKVIAAILLLLSSNRFSHIQAITPTSTAPPDTTYIQALIDSSYQSSFSDPARAIKFATRALKLSRKINFKKGLAGAHGELGYAYSVKGDFTKSFEHFKKGIAQNRAIGDTVGLVSQLNDMGTTYKKQSDYDQALKYYFEALDLCKEIKLKRGISATLGNIGLCYFEMEENDQALKYYQQALKLNKRINNKSSLAVNYNNIGLLYGDEGRYKLALRNHFKALALRQKLNYTMGIANSLNNIGRVYMQQKQYKEALDYLDRALRVNENRDRDLTSIIQENLTKVYLSSGRYDSALVHAKETLSLSKEYGSKLGEKVAYELLVKIYKEWGEYKKAYTNQQELMAVKDSILNAEKEKQINELQTKYETVQKEKEIALLQKKQERQTLLRNAALAGLILIVIIGILVYNSQRLKMKRNRTQLENIRLKEEKLEQDLEFKNKQLTTHTLHLVQKNEAMKDLKERIDFIRRNDQRNIPKKLQKLQNLVDYSFNLDKDWEQFQLYFDELHDGFFDLLKEHYPNLTPNELRLSALVKLNLSIKETATILGITPNSVKTARYRLRKKLDIETGENLSEFMMELEKEVG
ncbi:MAG TPA: tetratricopeptide repeat protein [Balneolaceae bacterium]|nr:tetratricopeptide repeat protein [Balneolaceae bacterium]